VNSINDNKSFETMASAAQGLSTPLLGDEREQERDVGCYYVHDEVHDEELGGCLGCTVSIAFEDEDDDEQDGSTCNGKDDDDKVFSWFDHVVVWIILPSLLFLQFGMAFYMSNVEAVTGLRWSVVNYSIVLFVITAVLYRQAAVDCKWTSSFIVLLPEILMDIILGMVLFDKIVAAFLFMLISMLCLAMFVVVCSIRVLIVLSVGNDDDEEEEAKDTKEAAQDKAKLGTVRLYEGVPVPVTQTE
jgi:hypothetical protein